VKKGIVWAVAAGIAALALVVAGCGDGDDTTASLTRVEFVKQANEICKKQEERRSRMILAALAKKGQGKALSKSEKEDLVLRALGPYEEIVGELEALGAPEGDGERIEELVKAMEKAAREIKADPFKAIGSSGQYKEANTLAEDYDLEECTL
jgi:hypothetical protein